MSTSKFVTAAAVAGTATLAVAAPIVSASAPPDGDYAFLHTDTVEAMIAEAENGSANCASLEAIGGLMFLVGFASMAEEGDGTDLGSHPAELLVAVTAPSIVPVLAQTTPPSDPAWAEAIDVITGELQATIDELRGLGLSDDDLISLQNADDELAPGGSMSSESSADETIPAQFAAMIDHDFESITFLDPDGALAASETSGLENLWGDECPETAGMFSFEMDPVDIEMEFSVTVGGSEPETHMEVVVNGTDVTPDTAG